MIEARVLAVKPHPAQDTHNPSTWAVQIEVRHDGATRAFWRWHTAFKMKDGKRVYLDGEPKAADVLQRFWDDTFANLHGFSFDEGSP